MNRWRSLGSVSMRRQERRIGLHVPGHDRRLVEVFFRRWRGPRPLQSHRAPRIRTRLVPELQRPDPVDHREQIARGEHGRARSRRHVEHVELRRVRAHSLDRWAMEVRDGHTFSISRGASTEENPASDHRRSVVTDTTALRQTQGNKYHRMGKCPRARNRTTARSTVGLRIAPDTTGHSLRFQKDYSRRS